VESVRTAEAVLQADACATGRYGHRPVRANRGGSWGLRLRSTTVTHLNLPEVREASASSILAKRASYRQDAAESEQ
jgi:hypothetical protein